MDQGFDERAVVFCPPSIWQVKCVLQTGPDIAPEFEATMELMDAFSFGEENTLDVAALLESFDKLPDGELVRVTSEEANVRVWIE